VALAAALGAASVGCWGCSRFVDAVAPLDCSARPADPDCAPTVWPTDKHGANSDPWLVAHHDVITAMQPRLLVLSFNNGASADDVRKTAESQIAALREGSRPHGYADPGAAPFLDYQIVKVVDLADHPPPAGWTNPSSSLLPTTPSGDFDATALFTARFADAYGFADPATPGRSLSLCELFEQGAINEVWIEDGEAGTRRAPLDVERKQVYDSDGRAVADSFLPCVGGGGCLDEIICGVTVRLAHLDPARGPGCDLQVRGWGIDGMWDALPAFAADARAFLDDDFDTRFGVRFHGWADICDQSGDACVSYPTDSSAAGTYADGTAWMIDPFRQGCGSSRFPPNARERGDFINTTAVQARCQGFGRGGGAGGGDVYAPYTADTVASAEAAFPDCGGGWQIYWRQSMPGPGSGARSPSGRPLKNWWPFLFY
jgi:hypothetical protein